MYYFVYSKQQQNMKDSAFKKGGKTYVPGKVTVNGKTQVYTSITQDLKSVRELFGDLKIITMTESLSTVRYTKPQANSLRRII